MQSQLRLRLWKCHCRVYCESWQFFTAKRQSGLHRQINTSGILTKWNESNCIVCAASGEGERKRENICHFTHRNPIQFRIEMCKLHPFEALAPCVSHTAHLLLLLDVIYKSCRRAKLLTDCIRVMRYDVTTTKPYSRRLQKKIGSIEAACTFFGMCVAKSEWLRRTNNEQHQRNEKSIHKKGGERETMYSIACIDSKIGSHMNEKMRIKSK